MNLKNEHGLVSVYVIIIVVFIMIIVIGKLILANNELQSKIKELENVSNNVSENIKVENSDDEREYENKGKVYKNDIPLYNGDDFMYFSDHMDEEETDEYYIYQEDAFYIGGKSKNYILMSDIYVDKDKSELVNWNKLIRRLNFNNHRIYTKGDEFITEF